VASLDREGRAMSERLDAEGSGDHAEDFSPRSRT
jgi:hypothetical protein